MPSEGSEEISERNPDFLESILPKEKRNEKEENYIRLGWSCCSLEVHSLPFQSFFTLTSGKDVTWLEQKTLCQVISGFPSRHPPTKNTAQTDGENESASV